MAAKLEGKKKANVAVLKRWLSFSLAEHERLNPSMLNMTPSKNGKSYK